MIFLSLSAAFGVAGTAFAGDSPAGFWYGADGSGPAPSGTSMPTCGGTYGSYVGRVDYTGDTYFNTSDANTASSNLSGGNGVGMTAYVDLEGPTDDPSYNATDAEAYTWGTEQAYSAAYTYDWDIDNESLWYPTYPIIFADMESGNPGWISGSSAINRYVFNGFYDALSSYTDPLTVTLQPGWYSGPGFNGSYMSGQTMSGTWGWIADWAYNLSGNMASGDCDTNGYTAPNSATPGTTFGENGSSGCLEQWQYASTNSNQKDWDQVDSNNLGNSCW